MTPKTPQRANFTYTGYEHDKHGHISDLPVVRTKDGVIYSVWRTSWRERLGIAFGVPVVVGIIAERQPPMAMLVGEENIG